FIVFSELVLVTHIRWTIEIHVRSSTVFEHIECSLYRVLLFVRVHPLRVTSPVMNNRRPRRHNPATVTNQTTIRVMVIPFMESPRSRRCTIPAFNVVQAPFGLTSGSRLNRAVEAGHFLE